MRVYRFNGYYQAFIIEKWYKEEYDGKNMLFRSKNHFKKCSRNTLLSWICAVFLCFWIFSPAYADKTDNTLAETDITEVGMDMFTIAYEWESKAKDGFNKQALTGFTKKLNAELLREKSTDAYSAIFALCECDTVVREEFDEYIAAHPTLKNTTGEISYGRQVWQLWLCRF